MASQKLLVRARQRLHDERDRVAKQVEDLEEAARLDQWSDARADLLDAGTAAAEREQSVREAEELRDRLIAVEEALERVEDGTYGTCDVCGKRIESARLDVLPITTRCVEHASAR